MWCVLSPIKYTTSPRANWCIVALCVRESSGQNHRYFEEGTSVYSLSLQLVFILLQGGVIDDRSRAVLSVCRNLFSWLYKVCVYVCVYMRVGVYVCVCVCVFVLICVRVYVGLKMISCDTVTALSLQLNNCHGGELDTEEESESEQRDLIPITG